MPDTTPEGYREQARRRYEWEPQIHPFAGFTECRNRRVLEIGVGLGADHQQFAEGGAQLWGLDLTARAITHTQRRLAAAGLHSTLQTADAEHLPFEDASFDRVYSWGVILCCPDMQKAVDEIARVLAPGGEARVMIYHRWSMVGYMLWVRYALLRGRPWLSLSHIYAEHLENPGTQAVTIPEAHHLFRAFASVQIGVPRISWTV